MIGRGVNWAVSHGVDRRAPLSAEPFKELDRAGEAADFPTMFASDLIDRGWLSLNPDWISAEFGYKYGSSRQIKRELKRVTMELLSNYINTIRSQSHRGPFLSHGNQTVSSTKTPPNGPKSIF